MEFANLPTSRADAKASGATHYFTGKSCKHGHVAPRLTKGTCTVCREIEWRVENERRKALPKSEAAKAAGRRYYQKNKQLVKDRASTVPAEKRRQYRNNYKGKNPELYREMTNLRRRRLREATPIWQTAEDKAAIKAVYAEAERLRQETGRKYVVDHILPLHGTEVCGLHVPSNLNIVTFSANARKGNKLLDELRE